MPISFRFCEGQVNGRNEYIILTVTKRIVRWDERPICRLYTIIGQMEQAPGSKKWEETALTEIKAYNNSIFLDDLDDYWQHIDLQVQIELISSC